MPTRLFVASTKSVFVSTTSPLESVDVAVTESVLENEAVPPVSVEKSPVEPDTEVAPTLSILRIEPPEIVGSKISTVRSLSILFVLATA